MLQYFMGLLLFAGGRGAPAMEEQSLEADVPSWTSNEDSNMTYSLDECDRINLWTECSSDKLPQKFPRTKDELQASCPSAKEFLECGVNYAQKCNVQTGLPSVSDKYLSVLEEVCDENTSLHAAVVQSLGCFGEYLEDRSMNCDLITPPDDKVEAYAEALMKEGVVDKDADSDDTRECILSTFHFACQAVKVKNNCGRFGMEIYQEIIGKLTPKAVEGCDRMNEFLPTILRLYIEEKEKE